MRLGPNQNQTLGLPLFLKNLLFFAKLCLMFHKQNLTEPGKNFFQALVKTGLSESGIQVSPSVKHYLSELLQFYIFSDHLFSEMSASGKKQMNSLAELYLNSQTSQEDSSHHLKKIGDMSLYISGFFRDSLKRKLISVDYYIQMGQNAFHSLASRKEEGVFKELAHHFKDLVFVLFCIHKKSSGSHHDYLLSLMDQYMDEPSRQVEKKLKSHGLHIPFKKQAPQ